MTTESQAYRLRALNEASLAGLNGKSYRHHLTLHDWFAQNADAIADLMETAEHVARYCQEPGYGSSCEEAIAAFSPVPEVPK